MMLRDDESQLQYENRMLEEHGGIVGTVSKRYYNLIGGDMGLDDLKQIGYMSLLKTIRNYDDTKGQFSTLAFTVMKNDFNKFANKRYKNKENEKLSLDVYINNTIKYSFLDIIEDDFNAMEDAILADKERFTNDFINKKPKKHRKIICMFLNGYKKIDISIMLKVSRGTVWKVVKEFLEEIKEEMENNY